MKYYTFAHKLDAIQLSLDNPTYMFVSLPSILYLRMNNITLT